MEELKEETQEQETKEEKKKIHSGFGITSIVIGVMLFMALVVIAFNGLVMANTTHEGMSIFDIPAFRLIVQKSSYTTFIGAIIGMAFSAKGFLAKDRLKMMSAVGLIINLILFHLSAFVMITFNLDRF